MLIPFAARPSWEQKARCRGEDAALFFGPNRFEPKSERVARESAAKEICRTCPVLIPCREHALAVGESFGVWGGLAESELRDLIDARTTVKRAG